MATTGTVSFNECFVGDAAMGLDQLEDVSVAAVHGAVLLYNESSEDAAYADGFVAKPTDEVGLLGDVNVAQAPAHNQLFAYNDSGTDSSQVSGWADKKLSELLGGFQVTVEGLVSIQNSVRNGLSGNPALSDMVAFTDVLESGFTMGISSCGDNNVVFKRELTDSDFVFMSVLSKGEISNLSYPSGTIFRSTKGLSGFSSTFPTPMGIASLSATYFRFFAFRQDVFVAVASAGLESVVTLYASNGTTVVDGPTTIAPYASTTLACDSNAEFIVTATESVYCASYADNPTNGLTIDQRLLPPMVTEIIVWNRFARVTAQESNTLVRWYRRNGETGIFTVNAGTPKSLYTGAINEEAGPENCGNTVDYGEDGCLVLRADKPISAFSGADTNGWEATPGWPLNQLAQVFANTANLGSSTDAGVSSVTIGSSFEGTGAVYDATGTLLTTFAITRSVTPATTADEQLYPAAGQFQPSDIGLADWLGGWVEVNVPSVCIMNFNGSSVFTSDSGDELLVPGVTPDESRSVIRKDAGGLYRRRDLDASGAETWEIC